MVSLATVVFPTASNRSTGWPASSPVAGLVVVVDGGGVGSATIRPASGRGTMVPGFGLGVCGSGCVCAAAVPQIRAAREIARSRVIFLKRSLAVGRPGLGKVTGQNTTSARRILAQVEPAAEAAAI